MEIWVVENWSDLISWFLTFAFSFLGIRFFKSLKKKWYGSKLFKALNYRGIWILNFPSSWLDPILDKKLENLLLDLKPKTNKKSHPDFFTLFNVEPKTKGLLDEGFLPVKFEMCSSCTHFKGHPFHSTNECGALMQVKGFDFRKVFDCPGWVRINLMKN